MGEMNQELAETFVNVEVDAALEQMDSLKSLGPVGMPHLFFQQFWFTIGD